VTVDGSFGPQSIRALQERLNAGQFTKPTAPAAKPASAAKPVPAPVEPAKPVTPAKPSKPTRPSKPAKPITPAKDPIVPTIASLPQDSNTAATDALGILIPKAKNRKLAYALYGLAALIISNLSVAVMASGTEAPIWLIVASAVVGNLAVPFTTLAIANASPKK
jgi:hypothetical protein